MTTASKGGTLRPLGAFERTIDLYMRRNPVQFSFVAELNRPVRATALATALAQLQDRHPLLRAQVEQDGPQAVFRTSPGTIPVTTAPGGTPWQAVLAQEQTRPIPAAPGPLARAVLVPRDGACALVLTFAHQIADGVGGLQALLDLVAALAGEELAPSGVPGAQEDLLAALPPVPDTPLEGAADDAPPAGDPRMDAPGELTPFTGRLPHVDTLALDRGLTTRLVRRCRTESTSVHAALCAAATVVLHRAGRPYVRVLSPVDLRRSAGLPEEVVVRFAAARTGSDARELPGFWTLARRTRDSLLAQRAPQFLVAGAAALAAHAPGGTGEAEAMMAAATAADIQITNVGVARPGPAASGLLSALWGPAQTTQLSGEHLLGVVTVADRLRLTECTHDPVPGFVPQLAAVLAASCEDTPDDTTPRGGVGTP